MMIEPYERERTDMDEEAFAKYVATTTIANTSDRVRAYIAQYLVENACIGEVRRLLTTFLTSDGLLAKTHIVKDGSYRNCTVLVRPDGAIVTHTSLNGRGDVYESLTWWLSEANVIHLNITSQTWASLRDLDLWDIDESEYVYDDHLDDHYVVPTGALN